MFAVTGWQRQSSSERFDEFFRALSHELGLDETAMKHSGVYERHGRNGVVSLAVDLAHRFVAADWQLPGVGRCESFFVVPASRPPHAGLRIHGLAAARTSAEAFLSRWTNWLPGDHPPVARGEMPTFFQLACALVGKGGGETFSRGLLEQLETLRSERDYLQQLLREQSDELRQVRADLRAATTFAAQAAEVPAAPTEAWSDLAELGAWCIARESEIVVLPRARSGAKKSRYEDPSLIFTALELLAGPYRAYRQGVLDREGFDALLPSGMRLSGAVADSVAGEQGDAYFVSWGGRRRMLDQHLAKGGGRDERYCLRIYFFWDDESERAIVGWLPSHLTNSLT